MLPPPNHTPLIALPVVVLDLETTGLDVRNDRIVQLAAIEMHGGVYIEKPPFERFVNPGSAIPVSSSKIHGIVDADVAAAPSFADLAEALKAMLAEHVIIGHNIGFDIAVLRHEYARAGIAWHEPAAIDVGQLLGALRPSLPDLGLETVTSYLGVQIEHRHSAIGDCTAAAQAWEKLFPILRDREVRTLGELQSLANQRQDLILRQAEAGWLAVPGEEIKPTALPTIRRIDSYIFEQRLVDLMKTPVIIISAQTCLRDATHTMIEKHVGALLVGEEGCAAQGIVTEKDLLRATLQSELDFNTAPVTSIMSRPVEAMQGSEMLYRALGRMDRMGVRHLCVTNDAGIPIGMVSQRDLLQHRARGPDMLSDALEAAHDAPALAAAYARVTSITERLDSEGLDGVDIARVISTELQALTARAAQLCIDRMVSEGNGKPPADWCVLVLGSGGRGESLLSADQDNALIHTGTDKDDPWFEKFGQLLADMLDAAGLPRCKGDVMVASRQWRGNIADWNQRIDHWLRRARPDDILNVDIFFDCVAIAGNTDMARRLHQDATYVASQSLPFINLLAQSVRSYAPRFSLLGRLNTEAGRINLKRDGLLPLVGFARALALRIGSQSRATPERLRDVVAAGRIADGDAERLIELHARLLTYILHQQLDDLDQGVPTGSSVEIKRLSRKQYTDLVHGLKHLDTMTGEIQSFIAG